MKKRILVVGQSDGPWDSFARDALEQYGISGHGSLHLSRDSTLRLPETLLEGTS
ncbi:hypothetical protein [Streptomyces sp. MMG1533]|uniref:hypothetical protein n=1 Tax=Streptomyces sp. MMG1533 TaxID=1415546 RepID=UPI000AD36A6D|nr:hypothetical protein [Streptomyces sp. MMG1533]